MALAIAIGAVALFVALGSVGAAQSGVTAAQQQYGDKVTICHKGKKTITVGRAAVPAHVRHGDAVGTCAAAQARAAKAKKAKKAKAAKAGKPDHAAKPNPGRGKGK